MDKTPREIEDERRAGAERREAESVRQSEVARHSETTQPAPTAKRHPLERNIEDERQAEVARQASAPTAKKPDERSGAPLSTEAKVDHLQTSILAGFDLLAQSLAIEVTQAQNKLLADGGGAANAGPDTKASVQQLGDMLNRFKVTVETLKKGAIGQQRRQEDLKSDRV